MNKFINYLGKVIQRRTGVSSISFIVVLIGFTSVIILGVICVCLLVEVFTNHTIASSLDGYATIIKAVAGLVASVVLPKALNNYGENKFKNNEE